VSAISEFEGTRFRLQRLRDAKLFSGWISEIDASNAALKLNGRPALDAGDKFFIQAFGEGQSITCQVEYLAGKPDRAIFKLHPPVKILQSTEDMRILVDGMKCNLKLGWFDAPGTLLDLSATGLGLQTSVPVERGETAEFSIIASVGEIIGSGEVRYCKAMDGVAGSYRVGLELAEFDRVNLAKWRRLLSQLTPAKLSA
jgi:hypothetical protein